MKRWLERWGPPLSLLLIAFALRTWNLGAQSLWYDEAYCWWTAAVLPLDNVLALSVRELIPPLTHVMLRGWVTVAGTSEFALRFSAVLLGVLAVAASGRVVWRLTQQRSGAIAAWTLFALATPLLWAAREVRMYGVLVGFTLLADVALLEALLGPSGKRRRWAWLWGLMVLAALYTLVLSGFWLIGQALFALLGFLRRDPESRRAYIRTLGPPALLAIFLYLPWLIAAVRSVSSNAGYWAGYLPPQAFTRTTVQGLTVSDFLPYKIAAGTGALMLLITVLPLLLTAHQQPWAALYPLLYAVVPLLIMGYIFREIPKWGTRHTVLFAPFPYLALAMGWGAVTDRLKAYPTVRKLTGYLYTGMLSLGTLLTLGILAYADFNLLANPAYAHEDWRGVAAYVQAHRLPGDVVIIETGSVFPAWAYYGGWEGLLPLPQDQLLDVSHVLHYSNAVPILNKELKDATNVWVITWLPEVTDPTDIVPTLLAELGDEEATPSFHEIGLRHFKLTTKPDFPPEPHTTSRPNAELMPQLQLWGITLPQSPHPADVPLAIHTWWRTTSPEAHKDRFYQASLRLADRNGEEWLRVDRPPGGGDYRPERWPAATPILGHFDVALPPGTPPDTYTATLTLYTPGHESKTTLLGHIPITRPTAPPEIPAGLHTATAAFAAPDTSITLLGVGLDQPAIKPCEALGGLLFWEAATHPPEPYEVAVTLGEHRTTFPLTPGYPPPQWQPGDRLAARFRLPISCRALDLNTPISIELLSASKSETLARWDGPPVHIKARRQFTPPENTQALPATVCEYGAINGQTCPAFASLLGYQISPSPIQSNTPLTVTLIWQAGEPNDTPRTVFVHVTPPNAPGPLITQHDAWPALGQKPTYMWAPSEIIVDPHPISGLPAGDYQFRVGMYGPDASGERLPLFTEKGQAEDNVLSLPIKVW